MLIMKLSRVMSAKLPILRMGERGHMLGEVISQEIQQIEHEKQCGCESCEAAKTLRHAGIMASSLVDKCGCPVCMACREMLKKQCLVLGSMLKRHEENKAKYGRITIIMMSANPYDNELAWLPIIIDNLQLSIQAMMDDIQTITATAHLSCDLNVKQAAREIYGTFGVAIPEEPIN